MKQSLRRGWVGLWLGWEIESNWTHPAFYMLLSVLRPISASLILVFMYLVVIGGDFATPQFAHLFIGHTFFLFVGSILFGISWTIFDDRDHYQMFRFIYMAPGGMYLYLLGRGGTRFAAATVAVMVNLIVGILLFKIPIRLETVHFGAFLSALTIGLLAPVFLGIFMAGIHLVTIRHAFFLGEGLAGVFYLLCGCIYTLDVLPPWAQTIGKALPFTYWFSAIRRSLGLQEMSGDLAAMSMGQLLGILAISTAALAVVGHLGFRMFERWALRTGKIDLVFNY